MYPIIALETGKECLEKRRNDEPWSASPFVRWLGHGDKFNEGKAASLFKALQQIRQEIGVDPLPSNRGKDFEAPASEAVHRELQLDVEVAASRQFWLWLTFAAHEGRFVEFVDWRFGTQKNGIDDVNYGIVRRAGTWEGLFARLWWRGNTGFDPKFRDPYQIARRGNVDIWRSHVIRQEYGRCRQVAWALIRYQYPDNAPESKTLTVKELRELAKRLRIVDASVSYEALEESDVRDLISNNVRQIRNAN